MGATLADGGVNPLTTERVVDAATCRYTLAVMTTAGLYETSGDWLYDVGLPGKSGIGGGHRHRLAGQGRPRNVLAAARRGREQRQGAARGAVPVARARARPLRLEAARVSGLRARAALLGALAAIALAACPTALADLADETALAEKHAPVVRLVEQIEECGHGEPFRPIDVELLFDEPTVALRGPWNAVDLVQIGPKAEDLAGLFEYHLDFPGHALEPGCDYERWDRRLRGESAPTVYAHVATDPGHPGKLALQYWLYYTYNDWNNLHEGDWEMIQLVFDAASAEEALAEEPVSVGYSQHEGAEAADWDEDKLELVDGSRPVVYPAAGSHANFFDAALYVGSSAEQGVGCDDTRGPHVEHDPEVITIPSDAAAARAAFPWITFEGRWGELQDAFFNGPTGPNLKTQWTEPITLVGRVATARLRRSDRRCVRHGSDGLLLRGGRHRLACARHLVPAAPRDAARPCRAHRACRLRRRAHCVATRRAAPRRAPPRVGADPCRRRPHVRQARRALPRHRCPLHPSGRPHLDLPGPRPRWFRPARGRHDGRGSRRASRCSSSSSARP